jgi:hypothetical protein
VAPGVLLELKADDESKKSKEGSDCNYDNWNIPVVFYATYIPQQLNKSWWRLDATDIPQQLNKSWWRL